MRLKRERLIKPQSYKLDRATQRMLLSITVAAMAVALVLSAVFTLLFARSMGAAHLALSVLWLIALVILMWAALVGRVLPVRGNPPERAWFQTPGLVRIVASFAGFSLLWMVAARLLGFGSIVQKLHWPVQFVVLIAAAGLASWLMLRQKRDGSTDQESVLQALEQRDRLLRGIARLSESAWLETNEPLSPVGRLRTTLRWWGEELAENLPNNGPVLLKAPYNRIAYEGERLLTALQDLGRSNERDERRVQEVEIEILSAIESAASMLTRPA
jgi:hypothetical protein